MVWGRTWLVTLLSCTLVSEAPSGVSSYSSHCTKLLCLKQLRTMCTGILFLMSTRMWTALRSVTWYCVPVSMCWSMCSGICLLCLFITHQGTPWSMGCRAAIASRRKNQLNPLKARHVTVHVTAVYKHYDLARLSVEPLLQLLYPSQKDFWCYPSLLVGFLFHEELLYTLKASGVLDLPVSEKRQMLSASHVRSRKDCHSVDTRVTFSSDHLVWQSFEEEGCFVSTQGHRWFVTSIRGCSLSTYASEGKSMPLFEGGKPAPRCLKQFSVWSWRKFFGLVYWVVAVHHESLLPPPKVRPQLGAEPWCKASSSFRGTFQLCELGECMPRFWCRSPVCSALCHPFALLLAKKACPWGTWVARSFVLYLPLFATAAMATFGLNVTREVQTPREEREGSTLTTRDGGRLMTSLHSLIFFHACNARFPGLDFDGSPLHCF